MTVIAIETEIVTEIVTEIAIAIAIDTDTAIIAIVAEVDDLGQDLAPGRDRGNGDDTDVAAATTIEEKGKRGNCDC